MKRILFVIDSLHSGGAEKSLISLLSLFDYDRYQVDLLMFSPSGLYYPLLPKGINVVEVPEFIRKQASGLWGLLKSGSFKALYARLGASVSLRAARKLRKLHSAQVSWRWMSKGIEPLQNSYDIAIAYSQGTPTYYVAEKVRAGKKLCWINTDYEAAPYNKGFDEPYYDKFNQVVAVSDHNKDVFVRHMPIAKHKTQVVYDIVSPALVASMADEEGGFTDGFEGIRILTIGRLVPSKGYDMALDACQRLIRTGHKVRWYVIGEGALRGKLETMIAERSLQDSFVLLGTYPNPYVFLKQCDIYVQPSRFEGFGLAIAEARIMRKPIVATNFTVVRNQLEHRKNGLIVNMSGEDLFLGIQELIEDNRLRQHMVANLSADVNGTEGEIEKVYALIES